MNLLDLDILKTIEDELSKYKDLTKVQIFNICINNKLAETLRKYNEEIDNTSEYLHRKSSARVLKALTKIKKVSDKDIIMQYMEDDE